MATDEYKEMIADCRAIIVHVERCRQPDYYNRCRQQILERMGRLQRELDSLDRYHRDADEIVVAQYARIEELGELRRRMIAAAKLKRLLELRDGIEELEEVESEE